MDNKKYELGMVLESIKNGYQIEIVEITKTLRNMVPKYKYKVKYLNAINMYKEIGTASLDKYYKLVK